VYAKSKSGRKVDLVTQRIVKFILAASAMILLQGATPSALAQGGCLNVRDSRLNNSTALDCGASVVVYLQPGNDLGIGYLEIYGVGGGKSQLLISIPSITYEIAPPARDRTLIEGAVIPGGNQSVGAYLMLDGTVLIEAAYQDGKPYVIVFDPDGSPRILYIAF